LGYFLVLARVAVAFCPERRKAIPFRVYLSDAVIPTEVPRRSRHVVEGSRHDLSTAQLDETVLTLYLFSTFAATRFKTFSLLS
jgi:hypothetical protein